MHLFMYVILSKYTCDILCRPDLLNYGAELC